MKISPFRLRAELFLACLALSLPAAASTLYWDNFDSVSSTAGAGDWNIATNWATTSAGTTNAAAAPVAADDVIFSAATVTTAQSVYLNANRSVNSLTFTGTSAVTILSSATASTGPYTLTLGTGGITVASGAGAATIGSGDAFGTPVRMTGSQSWTNNSSSTLQVRNSIAFNNSLGAQTLTIDGTGNTTIGAEIRNASTGGSTSSVLSLTKLGAGTLTLSGTANAYTGLTTVTAGTLSLSKGGGTTSIAGNVLVNGGTLHWTAANQIVDTAAIQLTSGAINLNNQSETVASLDISGGTVTTGTSTFNAGNVTLASGSAANFIVVSSGGTLNATSLTMSGTNHPLGTTSAGGNILIGGNSSTLTRLVIGSGGLSMTNQTIQINRGNAGTAGGQVVLNGDFTGNGTNSIGLATSGGASTLSAIDLGTANRTFTIASGTTTLSSPLTGTGGGFTKTGTGTLTLSSTLTSGTENTYTGATTITGGRLNVSTALANTSSVSIGNGVLALGAANLINDAAAINLGAGGVIEAGGSETFGTLTVSGAGTIDLSLGSSLFNLANSSSQDWTGGLLTILGWNGNTAGGGTEQVVFGTDATGLTGTQLSQIRFSLVDGLYSAKILANGEIVPDALIPEASPVALVLLGGTGLLVRRKRRAGV